MPYPDFSFGRGAIMEGAMTPTVMIIAALVATPGLLVLRPHFVTACRPGHFDKVCPKCVEILNESADALGQPRLAANDIEHLDDWPAEQKEAFRMALVDAVAARRPMLLRWFLRQGWRRQRTDIKVQPRSTIVTFNQAAAASGEAREWLEAVRAAKRAKREAVAGR